MRTHSFVFAVAAAVLVASAGARRSNADDRPMSVPTTAPGFGNLAGYEGGNAGGALGGPNVHDTSAYGFSIGGPMEASRGTAVYRSPSLTIVDVLPPNVSRSATGMSSYEARPYAVPWHPPYTVWYRSASPAASDPCTIPVDPCAIPSRR